MLPLPYQCPICNAELNDPRQLREHRMKKHETLLNEVKLSSFSV